MCTLVALLNPSEGYRLLFLENRDRPVEGYVGGDFRVLEGKRVAALYDYRSQGIVCGYALDTNLFGGVTNVLGYAGPRSRGVLLKTVLGTANDLADALQLLLRELKSGSYSAANFVLGDLTTLYRVENFRNAVHVTKSRRMQVATNHFRYLKQGRRLRSSVAREASVLQYFRARSNVTRDDLVTLASTHDDGEAVCRHGRTLASVIFSLPADKADPQIQYQIGYPCEGYRTFRV